MKLQIFSIYDSKAESWSRPHFGEKIGMVTRQFQDLANDLQHPIGQHPEDYCMFHIGEWDDDKGTIKMFEAKKSLGIALDYKKQSPSGLQVLKNDSEQKDA